MRHTKHCRYCNAPLKGDGYFMRYWCSADCYRSRRQTDVVIEEEERTPLPLPEERRTFVPPPPKETPAVFEAVLTFRYRLAGGRRMKRTKLVSLKAQTRLAAEVEAEALFDRVSARDSTASQVEVRRCQPRLVRQHLGGGKFLVSLR